MCVCKREREREREREGARKSERERERAGEREKEREREREGGRERERERGRERESERERERENATVHVRHLPGVPYVFAPTALQRLLAVAAAVFARGVPRPLFPPPVYIYMYIYNAFFTYWRGKGNIADCALQHMPQHRLQHTLVYAPAAAVG